MTFLDTLRKKKRELPPEFINPTRPIGSSIFAYNEKLITLVSYIPKKKTNVLVVSSFDHEKIDQQSGKPEVIIDYNDTKGRYIR